MEVLPLARKLDNFIIGSMQADIALVALYQCVGIFSYVTTNRKCKHERKDDGPYDYFLMLLASSLIKSELKRTCISFSSSIHRCI